MNSIMNEKDLLFSMEESIEELCEFIEKSKNSNIINREKLYYKIGTAIMWIGSCINKLDEIKTSFNPSEEKLKSAFLGAYNAQKHSISLIKLTKETLALYPSNDLYPSDTLYPSDFSCKWDKMSDTTINQKGQIRNFNNELYGKDILTTINGIKTILKQHIK